MLAKLTSTATSRMSIFSFYFPGLGLKTHILDPENMSLSKENPNPRPGKYVAYE